MFGLTRNELRFAVIVSVSHLIQHFLMRLLPPLIPILAVALKYPLWQLGLLVSIHSLGGGIAQAPIGMLSDRYDRIYILPPGIAFTGLAYVAFAFAPTLGAYVPAITVLGYTFQGGFLIMSLTMVCVGVGTAVVHPTAYPMITGNVSEENKGKVLGAFGSSSKVGGATAPSVIGVLVLVLVWEHIILVLGFVGILVGVALYFSLRGSDIETVPVSQKDDSNGDSDGSESIWERDNRTFLYPMVIIYVFFVTKMFASNGLNTFVPVFIVGVYSYSFDVFDVVLAPESVANFYFAALLLSAAISQLFMGGVTDRYDARSVILGCLGVATVCLVVLAAVDLPPVLLLLIMIVLGAGLWGLNPARDTLISEITPTEHEGRTFGYIWTAVLLTGSGIPVFIGYLLEAAGFREGFLVLALGTLLAFGSISLLYLDRFYVTSK